MAQTVAKREPSFVYYTPRVPKEILDALRDNPLTALTPIERCDAALASERPIGAFMTANEYAEAAYALPDSAKIILVDEPGTDKSVSNAANVWAEISAPFLAEKARRALDSVTAYMELFDAHEQRREEITKITRELKEMHEIGIALSSEKNLTTLLTIILAKAKDLANADAGSLYLVEEQNGEKALRFKLSLNDSSKANYTEFVMPLNTSSVAGYVAVTGAPLKIDDAYAIPKESEYQINRSFDRATNYFTISVMTVPMINHRGQTVGVIQLMNRKRTKGAKLLTKEDFDKEAIPFSDAQQKTALSLASQASVAIENAMLYEQLNAVFERFVRASVGAIDDRDQATSGHSERVSRYAVALANAVNNTHDGVYAGVTFNEEQLRELRYASLLHDFGKIGVRERVLEKAHRLYPEELLLIEERFAHIKELLRANAAEEILGFYRDNGADANKKAQTRITAYREERGVVDAHLETVQKANAVSFLDDALIEALSRIERYRYVDEAGEERGALTENELASLRVERGTLTPEERHAMESHVLFSEKFLGQIPWSADLARVTDIAAKHHENLIGTGYPYGLTAADIPLEARILTIADIYDSLTASDRPYKPSMSPEASLAILQEEAEEGKIDKELFDIFVTHRAFENFASKTKEDADVP